MGCQYRTYLQLGTTIRLHVQLGRGSLIHNHLVLAVRKLEQGAVMTEKTSKTENVVNNLQVSGHVDVATENTIFLVYLQTIHIQI